MKSDVSVVIITKNRKRFLRRCIRSVRKQKLKGKKEIVVVDSSGRPSKIRGVKYIYDENLGMAAARNVGVKNSKYNLIYFIDDDCICAKDCLQELVNSIGNNGGVGGAVLAPKTNLIGQTVSYIGYPAGGVRWYHKFKGSKVKVNRLSTCNCLYKRRVIQKVKGFNEKLRYGTEDDDLSRKVMKKRYSLIYNPKAIVHHIPRENIVSVFKWFFKRGIARVYLRNPDEQLKILFSFPRSSFLKFLFILLMIFIFNIFGLVISYFIILTLFEKKLIDFKTPLEDIRIFFLTPITLMVMIFAESLGSLYGLTLTQ